MGHSPARHSVSGPNSSSQQEQIVFEFPKNEQEVIRAVLSTYKGKRYCSLRLYFRGDNGWLPTKRGLTLSADHIPDLMRAVGELQKANPHGG